MTEKKQDQAKAEQQQTQAVELEDAKLEAVQGGGRRIDVSIDGVAGSGKKGISDGTSN